MVRGSLEMKGDIITFNLFARSQLKQNLAIYNPGAIEIQGFDGSFLQYMLRGREELDAKAGRYADSREHPFFPSSATVPTTAVRSHETHDVAPVKINYNARIMAMYLEAVPRICQPGDDNEYGQAATFDIEVLQTLSSRIHLGFFVAEAKFRNENEKFVALMKAGDWGGVKEALTNKPQEATVLENVRKKGERYQLDPIFIQDFYRDHIIPTTLDLEVDYLKEKMRLEEDDARE
jgi:chorismate mutase